MKLLFVLSLVASLVYSHPSWSQYKRQFAKEYVTPEEDEFRRNLYEENLVKIDARNQEG